MIHKLIEAFQLSLQGNTQLINEGTNILSTLQDEPEFCQALMTIVQHRDQIPSEIRQAALIQLKLNVSTRWKDAKTQKPLTQSVQMQIKDNLLAAIIGSEQHTKFLRLFEEIVKTIAQHEEDDWQPITNILNQLQNPANILPVLYFIRGYAQGFEYAIHARRELFEQFINHISPRLEAIITDESLATTQINYLIIKIVHSFFRHTVSQAVKQNIKDWMEIIEIGISSKNPQYEGACSKPFNKFSNEFYYFHTKKWILKILLAFCKTSNFICEDKVTVKELSDQWYDEYGPKFAHLIMNEVLNVPTTDKNRCIQFQLLDVIIKTRPQLLLQYIPTLLYKILPEYMKLSPDVEDPEKVNPLELYRIEVVYVMNRTTKSMATEIWKHASYDCMNPKNPLSSMDQNFTFISQKLYCTDLLDKQMAMYLLCSLRMAIHNHPRQRQEIGNLIQNTIIQQLNSPISFLRARALQVIENYINFESIPESLLKSLAVQIYQILVQDQVQFVKVRAAIAYSELLRNKVIHKVAEPVIQRIIQIIIYLMGKYDEQNLVRALEIIINQFASLISPLASVLIVELSNFFFSCCTLQKQKHHNPLSSGDLHMSQSSSIDSISFLLETDIKEEQLTKLEQYLINIVYKCMANDGAYCIDAALNALALYVSKTKVLSSQVCNIFPLIIYTITGLENHKHKLNSLTQLPEQYVVILKQLLNAGPNTQVAEWGQNTLINYIWRTKQFLNNSKDLLGNDLIEQLLEALWVVYTQKNMELFYESRLQKCCITFVVIYLIENVAVSAEYAPFLWKIIKYNLDNKNIDQIDKLNCQLFFGCVQLFNFKFLELISKEPEYLLRVVDILKLISGRYFDYYQQYRLLVGYCYLLNLSQAPKVITQFTIQIFPYLTRIFVIAQDEDVFDDSADITYYDDQNEEVDFQPKLDQIDLGKIEEANECTIYYQTIKKLQDTKLSFYNKLKAKLDAELSMKFDQLCKSYELDESDDDKLFFSDNDELDNIY